MKKIIRHVLYKTQCQFCGTEFAFEKSDTSNKLTADNKKILPFAECPNCGKETPATADQSTEIKLPPATEIEDAHADRIQQLIDEYETAYQAFNLIKDKNAVMHIAKMQQQIDTFKAALLHINERINNGNKCNLVYTEPLDDNDKHIINNIIRFIDEHAHAPEKDRTLEDIVAPAFKNDKAGLEDYCSKMNDAAKKLGIDPLNCSVEEAIKICDEFDKTKAENLTTVFDIYPQIKQSNALNIVVKTPLDEFTTDPEAELNEDDLNDIQNVLAKNKKYGYVTVSPHNKDTVFRRTFIAPNLDEKGFLIQDRFATELTTENGVKYMLFFSWAKINNQNAPYNEK